MSLTKKVFKGGGALLGAYFLSQGLRFASNLIVTRLLAPDLFGVMLFANALIVIINMFSDFGFSLSVIRSERGKDPSFLKSVFTIKFIAGLCVFAVVFLAGTLLQFFGGVSFAPPEALYNHPDLPIAIQIISFTAILNSMVSIRIDELKRELKFLSLSMLSLFSQAVSVCFTIVYAYYSPSIISLALSGVVFSCVQVVGSYAFFSRKNFGFAFDRPAVKEIFLFGRWLSLSSVVNAIGGNLDKFILGYFLTGAQMGLYAIAVLIFTLVETILLKLGGVLIPAFSEVIRKGPERISSAYYKVRLYRDALVAVIASMLVCNGDLAVEFLYDERYEDAGRYLQILSLAFFIDAALTVKSDLSIARGDSKIQMQVTFSRVMIFVVLAAPMYLLWGLYGILSLIVLQRLGGVYLLFRYAYKAGVLNWLYEARMLAFCVTGLAMAYALRPLVEYCISVIGV